MNLALTRKPMSILVVEDESLVAMNLELILTDLGHEVIGPVLRLRDLEALIDSGVEADAAILDINIAGESVFSQARRLIGLGIPVLFASGYGEAGLESDLADLPVVPKPYTAQDIAGGLGAIQPL